MLSALQRRVLVALFDGPRTIEELVLQIGLVEGGWHALLHGLKLRSLIVREPIGQSWRFQYALTSAGLNALR